MIALALAAGMLLSLPPAALSSPPPAFAQTWPVVRGAYHVHSERSDGTGTLDEIAAAAARAGLQFVIVTDHGDATRAPEPPSYRSNVLCIDAVEISTDDGHVVALDLPQAPYPLRGRARDVIEDVHRLGGFAVAAHPSSPKPALQWRNWEAPIDGLEWLNADSEWRDELWGSLGAMLLTYPLRPTETLAALLDRPSEVLAQWDHLSRRGRVIGLAGADAHARLGFRQTTDPYEDFVLARLPSYEVSFRAFVNHVILPSPFTGDAATDARLLTGALREGHAFTSIEGLARLGGFEAKATSGNAAATPGAYLPINGPVAIEAAIAAPAGTALVVRRNGELLYETRGQALRVDVGSERGVYRIEARLPFQSAASIPWVLTNPIYVGVADIHTRAAAERILPAASTRSAVATEAWTAEASDGSRSTLTPTRLEDGTPGLEWNFELAPGIRGSQYAAMRFPIDTGLAAHDRLQLRARSDQPRRVWAQLRAKGESGGHRWGKSFYIGEDLAQIELRFEDFRAFDADSPPMPPLARIDSLLLVVDTVNALPGTSGRVAITDLWFAR